MFFAIFMTCFVMIFIEGMASTIAGSSSKGNRFLTAIAIVGGLCGLLAMATK